MPTVSPTCSSKHEKGVRYSSPTRLVEDDDLTPPPRHPRAVIGLRLRADSNGSTNNAFFRDGHPPLPISPLAAHRDPHRRKKKKKKPKQQPRVIHVEEGEMADVVNRSTSRPKERNSSSNTKKHDFWERSAFEQNGFLADTTAASGAKAATAGNTEERRSSSIRNDSLRLSDMSMGDSLLGAGFLDSSMRLSDVLRESTTSSKRLKHRSSSGKMRGSSKTRQLLKESSSDFFFTVSDDESDDDDGDDDESLEGFDINDQKEKTKPVFDYNSSIWETLKYWLNPSPWLIADVKFDDRGTPYFEATQGWTAAGFVRHYLYNPIAPEFTSLQQFWWAVIIGIAMGVYTALWKMLIETGVDFVWETVPEVLLELGVFTDLEGSFPLYHYMWICPMIFSSILSYVFCILPVPIPGQNEWIKNLHARGVQDYRTFWPLFVLATLGMLSGLSLGPELPLVLTAGMFGSWLGMLCQQSMLQARVLNLTAASAAVGGFFGFPMAGALFVLEIPHRMGLQYFEALSPATISSIIAVVTNRIITGNDVTGYFKYPFLSDSLPSQIFTHAIVYGLYGAAIGIAYAFSVMKLKVWVHDWFHAPHDHHEDELHIDDDGSMDYHYHPETETHPLVEKTPLKRKSSAFASLSSLDSFSRWSKRTCSLKSLRKLFCCVVPYEPYRAALAGAIAGALCGLVAMFVPHTLFWGEAQLQNLIDRGRTPLPVFGQDDEPTADLTALGYCIIDTNDPEAIKAGFSMQCSILLMVSKTIVIGLSLGTGIIGGHFWGPLFIGCAASHFLGDLVDWIDSVIGIGGTFSAYPCLIILCTMGSAHVVTFRAHTAIMLILTLTISSFRPEDGDFFTSIAGDYSAVFPLLVISVFVSLMVSRQSIVFYKEQRSRGDITAVPEVLCEPGMQGRPLVSTYDPMDDEYDGNDDHDMDGFDNDLGDLPTSVVTKTSPETSNYRPVTADITQDDIERAFTRTNSSSRSGTYGSLGAEGEGKASKTSFTPVQKLSGDAVPSVATKGSAFSRLDELLSAPMEPRVSDGRRPSPNSLSSADGKKKTHRRTQSAPVVDPRMRLSQRMERRDSATRFDSPTPEKSPTDRSSRSNVVRVDAFGELHEHQPPLLEQARLRAASRELTTTSEVKKQHRRSPSTPIPTMTDSSDLMGTMSSGNGRGRRSRTNSASAASTGQRANVSDPFDSALSLDEIEASFNAAVSASINPRKGAM